MEQYLVLKILLSPCFAIANYQFQPLLVTMWLNYFIQPYSCIRRILIVAIELLYEIQKRMHHIIRRGERPFALTEFLFSINNAQKHGATPFSEKHIFVSRQRGSYVLSNSRIYSNICS